VHQVEGVNVINAWLQKDAEKCTRNKIVEESEEKRRNKEKSKRRK
jgi:hypothetical protein